MILGFGVGEEGKEREVRLENFLRRLGNGLPLANVFELARNPALAERLDSKLHLQFVQLVAGFLQLYLEVNTSLLERTVLGQSLDQRRASLGLFAVKRRTLLEVCDLRLKVDNLVECFLDFRAGLRRDLGGAPTNHEPSLADLFRVDLRKTRRVAPQLADDEVVALVRIEVELAYRGGYKSGASGVFPLDHACEGPAKSSRQAVDRDVEVAVNLILELE